MGFDSRVSHIGHSVAKGLPPLQYFSNCAAQALSHGDGPRHSLHASAYYREYHADFLLCSLFDMLSTSYRVLLLQMSWIIHSFLDLCFLSPILVLCFCREAINHLKNLRMQTASGNRQAQLDCYGIGEVLIVYYSGFQT